MNGIPDNQSNRGILDVFSPITKWSHLHSVHRLFAHNLFSKKLLFISAGTLMVAVPITANSLSHQDSSSEPSASTGAAIPKNEAETHVQLKQQATSGDTDGTPSSTSLTINGESVPLSENDNIHKVITTDQQTTNITVTTHSEQSAGSASNSNSVHIEARSTNQEGGNP